MGGADSLKAEGLVLQGMYVSHVRASREPELPIVSVNMIRMELGKTMATIRPRLHKAS
jgi:hypothetical protein